MLQTIRTILVEYGIPGYAADLTTFSAALLAVAIIAYLAYWIATHTFVPLAEKTLQKTSFKWDDAFVTHRFFRNLAKLIPVVIFYSTVDILFINYPVAAEILRRLILTLFVFGGLRCLTALLKIASCIYSSTAYAKDQPITGYVSVLKIVLYLFAGIFTVSILTDKSPWGIFSVLGGLTAVLLLIFKDTILGFVASLQLFSHNMVKVGDWIEMSQYGADGDVIDVNIHTVKVQNWDKTITTIPTYALVSNSFKNWRGMKESGGRRIKRAINIDMQSIRFCDDTMLEKFQKFQLIADYIKQKQEDILQYNKTNHIDVTSVPNGRRQTNVGVFRAYVQAYLKKHPLIHQDMTFLVRHLQPTAKGLPIEIYVFSRDQVWANYESIQADIFDHILAVIPEFGLRVFQEPTGYDFQKIAHSC